MSKPYEINFVVHKGPLEIQGVLLAASLRYFNQKHVSLCACVPKEFGGLASGISSETKTRLEEFDVSFKEIYNPIGKNYLIGNKLGCLQNSDSDYRVFLDTDMLCCQKISFPEIELNTIALKPADRRTYNWSKREWNKAYQKYTNSSLDDSDVVISTAFNELMLPYFNAGVVIINGCHNFAQSWIDISKRLDADNEFNGKRPWLDQLALPLTIKKLKLNLHCLTETHNFPANIKPVKNQYNQLVHYHKPDLIARNAKLISTIKEICLCYPWIIKMLENDLWENVTQLVNDNRENIVNTYLVTGIPGIDTNVFSKILDSSEQLHNAHCELKTLKPLQKRNIPWGVAGYLADTQQDMLLIQKKEKLKNNVIIISNGLSYITSLQRLFRVLPTTKFIGLFCDPLIVINNWVQKPEKNFMSELDIIENNKTWLSNEEIKQIETIQTTKNIITRYALWWNFFALQLLNNKFKISLVDINDLILKPQNIVQNLFKDEKIQLEIKKTIANNPFKLNAFEKQQIINLTSQIYFDLTMLKVNC